MHLLGIAISVVSLIGGIFGIADYLRRAGLATLRQMLVAQGVEFATLRREFEEQKKEVAGLTLQVEVLKAERDAAQRDAEHHGAEVIAIGKENRKLLNRLVDMSDQLHRAKDALIEVLKKPKTPCAA